MKIKLLGLILSLILLAGCSIGFVNSAYVSPDGSCGYIVMLNGVGDPGNVRLSKCMTLEDATKLANQINKDMDKNWSSR